MSVNWSCEHVRSNWSNMWKTCSRSNCWIEREFDDGWTELFSLITIGCRFVVNERGKKELLKSKTFDAAWIGGVDDEQWRIISLPSICSVRVRWNNDDEVWKEFSNGKKDFVWLSLTVWSIENAIGEVD